MNFAVVVELACLVAYVTVLVGGRMSREDGWKVLSPLLALCAVGQAVAMALVVGSFLSSRIWRLSTEKGCLCLRREGV